MTSLGKVCILGGTHGNELSGVYMIQRWRKNPEVFTRASFTTDACIANPRAVEARTRYIDVDLNRSFSPENLKTRIEEDTAYEIRRVQELKAMLSEGGKIGRCDLVLDLHNTTANTKVCLIHRSFDDVITHMMHYVMSNMPKGNCRVLSLAGAFSYHDTRSLAPHGIGIEVGPQPQGVLRADIFKMQQEALHLCLDFVEKWNNGDDFPETDFHSYETFLRVPFPEDKDDRLSAMIHPDLQDRDFTPLNPDSPVFLSLAGEALCLKDVVEVPMCKDDVFYPVFVNEAAYYEKKIAFILTKKRNVHVKKRQKSP